MLGLVVIIAQGGRQRDAFSSVDLRWAGVAGQALRRNGVHLAEAEDQPSRKPQCTHALRAAGQIIFLQRALIGVHVTIIGLRQPERNMLVGVRQQHVYAAATGDTVAPCRRLELRSGNLRTTGREVHKGDEVLAQEEAVHGPCFYCVEPIGHAAECTKGGAGDVPVVPNGYSLCENSACTPTWRLK